MAAAVPRRRRAGSSARASKSTGAPIRPHTLLIGNHTSWLDILVLGGATGCAFVSKDNLGHRLHPLARRPERDRLRQAQPCEGRQGPGDRHRRGARARQAGRAVPRRHDRPRHASAAVPVDPARSRQISRRETSRSARWRSTMERRRRRSAGGTNPGQGQRAARARPQGHLAVTVRLLEPLDRSGDRKRLAQAAREAIARTLGFKLRAPLAYSASE